MRVYLDNCCYNRPFDVQDDMRVHLESLAKLELQERIRNGSVEMAWSYVLDYEISKNPYAERREAIEPWIRRASVIIRERTDEIESCAEALRSKYGFKAFDSLHVACAIVARCDYMVTTDDKLLKSKATEIEIVSPVNLV